MSAKTKTNTLPTRIAPPPRREPTHDEVALCARAIWDLEGCPQGRELEHWLRAEARLREGFRNDAEAAASEQPRRSSKNGSKRSEPEGVAL